MATLLLLMTLNSALHPGEVALGLRRLETVGSVLYVAAHPDDENTHLLAWLVGAAGVRAGYLSMTRGDGGQNLVGTEQDALLGLIRTHELLAARRIDKAEQLFTRARDFGYSKSADETLRVWGHDEVLADVVLAIRRFRPDVIVTRFGTNPPNHGHHTASALLAAEAFSAAADATRFPEQLSGGVTAWQADRLLQNVSTWGLPHRADLSSYLKLDVGGYEPLLGRSWGELAAESRSQHKSQGFGVAAERGPLIEYFRPLAGTLPKNGLLEGLDLSWRRFQGSGELVKALGDARGNFDARAPHKTVGALMKVIAALQALPDDNRFKAPKLREAQALVAACTGVFFEARAADPVVSPGGQLKVELLALNRSPVPMKLVSVALTGAAPVNGAALAEHVPFKASTTIGVAPETRITTPYWLRLPPQGGLYQVDPADRALQGRPEGEPPLSATFTFEVHGKQLSAVQPVVYGWTDPVRGELFRQVEVAPDVTATPEREVVMFANGAPQSLGVALAAGRAGVAGTVRLELPEGWRATPALAPFELSARGDERTVRFVLTPPRGAAERQRLKVLVDTPAGTSSWRAQTIEHDHLPVLTARQTATVELQPVALVTRVKRLGYVPGPGDKVAESLTAVGYQVTTLTDERLATEDLAPFEAIVVGVRAFNSNPRLAALRERLLDYVAQGGRLVVQYNTSSRIGPLNASLGPWPLELGRDRVTDENAAMTWLNSTEPLLRAPNRLGPADFAGWVQERGLYFASKWDERYKPVLAMADPGEEPLRGGLLVGRHGKGLFVYTGLSFFRQLPAGVPGAYRLLANLLAQ